MASMATKPLSDVLTAARLAALRELASKYGIHDLRIFGSYARGEATADSDLDLLVTIEDGPGLAKRFISFHDEVQKLFGMRVDVLTEDALNPRLHARILREAQPLR